MVMDAAVFKEVLLAVIGVMTILANALLIGFKVQGSKEAKKSGGNGKTSIFGNGFKAPPCTQHGERITALETAQKNTGEQLALMRQENREDHNKIFDQIKK